MNLRDIDCEEVMWMELAESHVRWWALAVMPSTTVFIP
jgi:hypothetical protein